MRAPGDGVVRDRTVHADTRLVEKRLEPTAIAVVAVIGGVRAVQIDGHGSSRQCADGFEEHVRRLGDHQAAEKAQA